MKKFITKKELDELVIKDKSKIPYLWNDENSTITIGDMIEFLGEDFFNFCSDNMALWNSEPESIKELCSQLWEVVKCKLE